jgi:chloramphenicol O-acetyltransferase
VIGLLGAGIPAWAEREQSRVDFLRERQQESYSKFLADYREAVELLDDPTSLNLDQWMEVDRKMSDMLLDTQTIILYGSDRTYNTANRLRLGLQEHGKATVDAMINPGGEPIAPDALERLSVLPEDQNRIFNEFLDSARDDLTR